MTNNHIVICTGGNLGDWAIPYIKEANLLIGADKGALFLVNQNFTPYLSIGDFDSVSKEELQRIKLNSKHTKDFDAIDKDFTDTELAIHEALALHPTQITIVGGLGSRFDHSLANIQLLAFTDKREIPTCIIDEHNTISVISSETQFQKSNYSHLSILPFTDVVSGITLIGMKYPLNNATIYKGQTIGISNIIEADVATIQLKQGKLLVIQAND